MQLSLNNRATFRAATMEVEAVEVVAAVCTQTFLVSLAGEQLLIVHKDQQKYPESGCHE